jgi:serine protease Do
MEFLRAMTNLFSTSARGRRIRNALLASVFSLGIVGGTSAVILDGHMAFAQPVEVHAQAPADFSAIVEQVAPAVVSVQVKTKVASYDGPSSDDFDNLPPGLQDFFRRFQFPPYGDNGPGDRGPGDRHPSHPREGLSQGSGFFISQDGYLVTNAHVVADGTEFQVVMDDGRQLDAKLVGVDKKTDLALLKVDGHDFKYVTFAKETPKVGQWVLAVGNPFGLGGTVTAGIISAEGRDIGSGPYDDYLQIDAPVNRGNSGGPAFNVNGEVVGVNTAIYSPSGGNVGIAFAIPASIVSDVVGDLETSGTVTRGWLGVQIQPVTKEIADSLGIKDTQGALVADATPNGPAVGAGIKSGDIITAVDGQQMKDPKALSEAIARIEPGKTVTITLERDGKSQDVQVKLGNMNDLDKAEVASADNHDSGHATTPGSLTALGLSVEPNPDGQGVRIAGVSDDSPASDKGLQAGDVIVAIGSKDVNSVSDLESGIADAQDKGRDAVLFRIQGENGTRFVGVPFERG